MRKILDTIATIFFIIAAIAASIVIAGIAAWLCTIVITFVCQLFLGWEISLEGGNVITVIIAVVMLASFWVPLLFSKKKKE